LRWKKKKKKNKNTGINDEKEHAKNSTFCVLGMESSFE